MGIQVLCCTADLLPLLPEVLVDELLDGWSFCNDVSLVCWLALVRA